MGLRSAANSFSLFFIALIALVSGGCNPTKHLPEGAYLLRDNNLKLSSDKGITRRGELKDNIERLIVQKPNSYLLFGKFPHKVWVYNLRYKKYSTDTQSLEKNKFVEAPVVYDSTLVKRSVQNIRSYLFNQGYFYPRVDDTTILKQRKAYVHYNVETGVNFLIRKTTLDVDDSAIYSIVNRSLNETILKEGQPFAMSLLEQERSRITSVLREHGYYRFTQENVVDFKLDTFNKDLVRDVYNPFETAINFLAAQKEFKKPTLDIKIIIRSDNKQVVYKRYAINNVTVYPDFVGRDDIRDSSLHESVVNDVKFRYHNYYVKEKVILKNIFLEKNKNYTQSEHDATINKLNQLGVFQTIRIFFQNDTTRTDDSSVNWLNAIIIMTPAKQYDLTGSFEVSTGTTYMLGAMPTISFRNFNLGKGANLWTTSVSYGLESTYNSEVGNNFLEHFSLLTQTFAFNTSINFPKFIAPFGSRFTKKNLPRTVIGFGTSLLDRVNYFTLTNTVANLTYNWRETSTKNWEISPAFVNVIRLPNVSDSFKKRLENNDFLRNSYRQTFIEGEIIAFTFSNQLENKGRSYSYARLGLEEAGGLMGLASNLGSSNLNYSQYLRLDFDARRYINRRRSQIAFRFYGGVGIPYGTSTTLPYIKQYFVGGAYSIRGWRIRTLGPGSYYNPLEQNNNNNFIDRTGDIKLEMNGEYRFGIVQLFSGGIKVRGAVFADAGNIWLMKKSSAYPGGEFKFSELGNDIAISAGIGLRVDMASFIILRIDIATKVKQPIGDNTLRAPLLPLSDMITNFAIGYPF
ncbi:MAG TPA: BamA/TamA family outer membrane protein [Flavipsychrobacter sp.]|nr:BamA/TamA family outer membrane protein [Flavipsychrobacter sp.]